MLNNVRNVKTTVDARLQSLLASASGYLQKAVQAREKFYQGMDEAAMDARTKGERPADAKYAFGKSQQGGQIIADNKWHMAQSRTFGTMAIARAVYLLVKEHQRSNKLLEENNTLLKEVRDALRRSGNS